MLYSVTQPIRLLDLVQLKDGQRKFIMFLITLMSHSFPVV